MKYKLLVLDLDGTTVKPGPGNLPSKRVHDAIKMAQTKLDVTIATGRPLFNAMPIIEALELKGHGVINNGAQLYDFYKNELILARKISTETLIEIFKICSNFDYEMRLYFDNEYKIIDAQEEIKGDAEKFFLRAVKTIDAPKIMEELEGVSGVAPHTTKSWVKGDVVDFHVTHVLATKRQGVERLIEILGLKKEEVMAIGDDHNDVPLMMAAGTSVAMGDAPEQVKKLADHVSGNLEEDGVAQAIEKFILN